MPKLSPKSLDFSLTVFAAEVILVLFLELLSNSQKVSQHEEDSKIVGVSVDVVVNVVVFVVVAEYSLTPTLTVTTTATGHVYVYGVFFLPLQHKGNRALSS